MIPHGVYVSVIILWPHYGCIQHTDNQHNSHLFLYIYESIKQGAAKEKCFTSNNTPSITFACASNNLEAVQILLAAGVNVNAMGDEGLSSMDHAVENGNLEMVNDLIEAGYDMKRAGGAGLLAAKTGNTSLMQALITAGIDVNAVGSVNTHAAFDGRGQKVKHTALTIAVEVDDEAMVDLLLNRNANPNLYGPLLRVSANILNIGTSAPHNFTAIAMKLVEAGADVNAQFDRERDYQKWANYSPLTVCFNKFQDYTDLVTFYLDKGQHYIVYVGVGVGARGGNTSD